MLIIHLEVQRLPNYKNDDRHPPSALKIPGQRAQLSLKEKKMAPKTNRDLTMDCWWLVEGGTGCWSRNG